MTRRDKGLLAVILSLLFLVSGPQEQARAELADGVMVAVLDTGLDLEHPVLKTRLARDSTGRPVGRNFVNDGGSLADDHGHGTHVAGIVSETARDARIMPVKVLGTDGKGVTDWTAGAIRWAVDQGASIILVSHGSTSYRRELDDAVRYAWGRGALIIAAAGNRGAEQVVYPAGHLYAIGVGALSTGGTPSKFSNSGQHVSVVAPGEEVVSSLPTYPVLLSRLGFPKERGAMQGTSQAAARVAGIGALLWQAHPEWTNRQVYSHLLAKARPLGGEAWTPVFGYGRLDESDLSASDSRRLASLRGQVVDLNGQPVVGVTVKVGDRAAVTASDGMFRVDGLGPGNLVYSATVAQVLVAVGRVTISLDEEAQVLIRTGRPVPRLDQLANDEGPRLSAIR